MLPNGAKRMQILGWDEGLKEINKNIGAICGRRRTNDKTERNELG